MTRIQKIFKSILPASWAESMEKESCEWMMRCENCDFEKSVWDFGGIRWKAKGNPRKKLKCRNCGQNTWHLIHRNTEI